MDQSTHYNLNLVTGSDKVNPLTVDRPNYETIDEQMYKNQTAAISEATELKSGTVHAITCLTEGAIFFRFTATSDYAAGDTFTYNGTPVSAVLPDGSGLQAGVFKINGTVLCSIVGTLLTVYSITASGIASDSEKLGGQLPAYYAKATDAISTYVHSRIGTVNNFVGTGANGKVKIVANIQAGDTVQINGQTVAAFAGANDFVETFSGQNLVGKTLFFIYDSGSQTVNFNIGGGLSSADAAKLIPQNIRYGVKFFEGTNKEVIGDLKPLFVFVGWTGSAYWGSDLNGNFYGPSQTSFTLQKTPVMAFVSIKGAGTNDGIQIGEKVLRGEGNYIVTDIVGNNISVLTGSSGAAGTYFSICALG